MKKLEKTFLIILILLINILLLSIKQSYPISISLTTASCFNIPVYYWLVVGLSPLVLYIISKLSKNIFIPIFCIMVYYFVFFSYGFYFISHPTISDIGSSTLSQELLSTTNFFRAPYINIVSGFEWPIHYIFSKLFSSVLGITSILTINIGFMSLITIFPVFLILFFKQKNDIKNNIIFFMIPAVYLSMSYYFLNDQFVPQFLALIYLVILFGCYIKYRETKNRLFFVFVIIFYALTVFSHAFMYIFFLIAILFEKIWGEYVEKSQKSLISYEMIILLFSIPFAYFNIYIEEFRRASLGESWKIFDYISSQRAPIEGYQIQPLYQMVPDSINQFFSIASKVIVIVIFAIVAIGFLLHYLKKREVFDLGIISGSFIWFIMGLTRLVLGQRALQVIPLALSNYFKYPSKLFSYFFKIVIVIILLSPIIFVANTMINESLEGERLIQDNQENIAGRFIDKHISNDSRILMSQNAYPTLINQNSRRFNILGILQNFTRPQYIDFIINSPKLKLRSIYFNYELPINPRDFVLYNSNKIQIFSIND